MSTALPAWRSVLAVVAHPDDQSFGLGALLSTFVDQGATVSVLCLTRSEALHPARRRRRSRPGPCPRASRCGRRARHRQRRAAGPPRRDLSGVDLETLVDDVTTSINVVDADGFVVFDVDGVTGHPDHRPATEAALEAGEAHRLPVLGWTVPAEWPRPSTAEFGAAFSGHDPAGLDVVVPVDRSRQSGRGVPPESGRSRQRTVAPTGADR